MNKESQNYVNNLGLGHLNWEVDGNDHGDEVNFVLLLIYSHEQYSIELGMHSCGNAFMSPDDDSFCGPVRNVVASAAINI